MIMILIPIPIPLAGDIDFYSEFDSSVTEKTLTLILIPGIMCS